VCVCVCACTTYYSSYSTLFLPPCNRKFRKPRTLTRSNNPFDRFVNGFVRRRGSTVNNDWCANEGVKRDTLQRRCRYIIYTNTRALEYTVATVAGVVVGSRPKPFQTNNSWTISERYDENLFSLYTYSASCAVIRLVYSVRTTTPPPAALFVGPYRFNYSTLWYLRRTPFGQVL